MGRGANFRGGGFSTADADFPEMGGRRADPPSSRPPQSLATKAAQAAGASSVGSQGGGSDKWSSVFNKPGSSYGDRTRVAAAMPSDYAGSNRGYGRREEVADPRFAGKFGQSAPPRNDARVDQDGFTTVGSAPLPTLGPTKDDIAREKESKEKEKAARKAAREAEEAKKKAEKEAAKAAKEAAAQAAKEAAAQAEVVAKEALDSGLKGDALAEHISGLQSKPTCAALLKCILGFVPEEEVNTLKWSLPEAYGTALKSLCKTTQQQVDTIYVCQQYCHDHKFPKIGPKKSALIQLMFQVLYKYEIVDEYGFSKWRDDESDVAGRVDATVQTTPFMQILFQPEEDEEGSDDDEDEEEEEIDAPRETC
eukprot:GSChrysophyteH1.ASY1.ANO1.506.1 assembled CDS